MRPYADENYKPFNPFSPRQAEEKRQIDEFIGNDVFLPGIGRTSAVDNQGDNLKQPMINGNANEIAINANPNLLNTISKNISNVGGAVVSSVGGVLGGIESLFNTNSNNQNSTNIPVSNSSQVGDAVESQGLGNASSFLKENSGTILKGLGAGASVYNNIQANEQLDSSMSNIRNSINDLTNVKGEISSQYSEDVTKINQDLSEGMQMNALNLMSQVKVPEVNSNLSTGRASQVAKDAINNVQKRLDVLFDSQKQKAKDITDQLNISADTSLSKVSTTIDSLQTELGKMEQAKRNNTFNSVVDAGVFAASFVDPTGGLVSGTIGSALKKSNEYS